MDLPLPRWFAHRGGGALLPENTLAGIHLAARLGYRAVEFDVMLSRDGTPILIHDDTLERTTNGAGPVSETADAVLFALDAGQGERIPRFSEAAVLCRHYGLLANVEIKPAPGHEIRTAEVVASLTAEYWRGAAVQPLISSFSLAALAVARDVAPEIRRGVLYESVPAGWHDDLRCLQVFSLHCAGALVSDDVLADCRGRGMSVLCYTINTPADADALFKRGVSSLFTDRLDLFSEETTAYKDLQLGG